MIKSYLKKLSDRFISLKLPVVHYWKTGLSEKEIEDKLSSINLIPSKEFIEMYTWKNGSDTSKGARIGELYFLPGYYFLSIEDALLHNEGLVDVPKWNKKWFPVFTNGGGSYLSVILDAKNNKSPVVEFVKDEEKPSITYSSLTSMMRLINEAIDRKIIFKNKNTGYLDMDYKRYYGFLKKNFED
jgi:hypothetical protein